MLRNSLELSRDLDLLLSNYAVRHTLGKSRPRPEIEDNFRSRFQLDRDRVLHSTMFRRLKNKTQVFTPKKGDHFRDRLTHTLEVSQISRSLARILRLNEDLAEVIALAHDLGHTPFGHAGEVALRESLEPFGLTFEHNQQSLYLVEPLNLNIEVLEGLQKHQTPYDQASHSFIGATLEAQIVNFADEIAYHHHDLDDGLRSGIIRAEDFQQLKLFKIAKEELHKHQLAVHLESYKDRLIFTSKMMKLVIFDLATETEKNIRTQGITSLEDVYNHTENLVAFSSEMEQNIEEVRTFLFDKFYSSKDIVEQNIYGQNIIKSLFNFYLKKLDLLPKSLRTSDKEPVIQVKDYISGMTDSYALTKHQEYALS